MLQAGVGKKVSRRAVKRKERKATHVVMTPTKGPEVITGQ